MFNSIAGKYDFLNHFLSMGIDKMWRRKAVEAAANGHPYKIIDIATGTSDLAIEACRRLKNVDITGVDISEKMLAVGKEKIIKAHLNEKIHLQIGDAENLAFPNAFFDAAMVAFGVRNFENLKQGLAEINRVLKEGGRLVILEFSQPRFFLLKGLFNLYFTKILPFIGKKVSKDSRAYTYLPESVQQFPDGEKLVDILRQSGFAKVTLKRLTIGIATIYVSVK